MIYLVYSIIGSRTYGKHRVVSLSVTPACLLCWHVSLTYRFARLFFCDGGIPTSATASFLHFFPSQLPNPIWFSSSNNQPSFTRLINSQSNGPSRSSPDSGLSGTTTNYVIARSSYHQKASSNVQLSYSNPCKPVISPPMRRRSAGQLEHRVASFMI